MHGKEKEPDEGSEESQEREDVAREGGENLAVTGVTVAPNGNGKRLTATYTVAAPGGSWGAEAPTPAGRAAGG